MNAQSFSMLKCISSRSHRTHLINNTALMKLFECGLNIIIKHFN